MKVENVKVQYEKEDRSQVGVRSGQQVLNAACKKAKEFERKMADPDSSLAVCQLDTNYTDLSQEEGALLRTRLLWFNNVAFVKQGLILSRLYNSVEQTYHPNVEKFLFPTWLFCVIVNQV